MADGPDYRISNNRFRSDNPHEVAFVRNRTAIPALLEGNGSRGNVVALVGPGSVIPTSSHNPGRRARSI